MKKAQEERGEIDPADAAFESELRAKFPTRWSKIRRFEFPLRITDARAVYLLEMNSKDTIRAAEMADSLMTDVEKKSNQLTLEAERRESVRLSIVGLVQEASDGSLARRIIEHAAPFLEIDDWSTKTWSCLYNFHHELNGLPVEEVKKAVAGGRALGAGVPAAIPIAAGRTR